MRHLKAFLRGCALLAGCAFLALYVLCAMLYYPFRPPRDPNEWIDPV